MQRKSSYDFYLILATTIVLFIISALCIYGMFYFRIAQLQQMPAVVKVGYLNQMNTIISPFLIVLILLLGICVPKRLLPTAWLNRFTIVLFVFALVVSLGWGIKMGLIVVLIASLVLQLVVLVMVLGGSQNLHFERKGYWVRLGSSLLHLGLILFILDLFFYEKQTLHLVLFWIMTAATVTGMLFCFYADTLHRLIRRKAVMPDQADNGEV